MNRLILALSITFSAQAMAECQSPVPHPCVEDGGDESDHLLAAAGVALGVVGLTAVLAVAAPRPNHSQVADALVRPILFASGAGLAVRVPW